MARNPLTTHASTNSPPMQPSLQMLGGGASCGAARYFQVVYMGLQNLGTIIPPKGFLNMYETIRDEFAIGFVH